MCYAALVRPNTQIQGEQRIYQVVSIMPIYKGGHGLFTAEGNTFNAATHELYRPPRAYNPEQLVKWINQKIVSRW